MPAAINRIRVGGTTVIRVMDWVGPAAPVADLFPDTPADLWTADGAELSPWFYEASTGSYRAAMQTWVVESGGQTILIDTGVGDDRDRPQAPQVSGLRTGYLERLGAAGVDPNAVDVVVNTHIHYDHVGWNTHLVDGAFVPTFPNARYLVPQDDYRHFHPDQAECLPEPRSEDERRRRHGAQLVFADSITPVEQAGQLVTWSGPAHSITETLTLTPAPGHTPGSSVAWLDDGESAVFAGDLLHTPLQLARPGDSCSFDLDPTQATRSRRRVLDQAARLGALLVPAHFAGHGAATIESTGTGYRAAWCALPQI